MRASEQYQTTSKFLFSLSAINSASSTFESVFQLMTQYCPYYSRRSSDFRTIGAYTERSVEFTCQLTPPLSASLLDQHPSPPRLLFNFHDLIIFSFQRRAHFAPRPYEQYLPNFTFFFLLQRRAQPEPTTMKNYRHFTLL